ncbi:GDSL-like lipase/acylhydrolase family protein [Knoellia remsis]|uniref:GDSL-like lipase/acylhydrolase family protein n=1 Tax=Knoellia remsis TaxID=407159 RepID=A0A2T0UXL5_9MICO|nr:SGNH/GDSL hydrolase family protein [Knoellia remsis]PRY62588.1 GDSL-like lipase/acylhydrolase family protein [Knoellia remsis]
MSSSRRTVRTAVAAAWAAALLVAVPGAQSMAATERASAPTQAAPAPDGDAPAYERYVALGDSYTAAPLVPNLDIAGGCYRSTNNYPSLLARELGVTTFVDASCSGADTTDMTQSQLAGVAPQLDNLTPDTDLVTLSIGGNDFNVFGTLVGYCTTLRASDPTGSPCRDEMRSDGQDRLLAAVKETRARIDAVIAEIEERSPDARILVVGYPQIAPRQGTCPDLLPLADGDVSYAVQVNKRLTDALRQAAKSNQVEYVDVWKASQGHDICSGDPWVNGQVTDITRAQNYHPFANEQRAIADLLIDELT